MSNDRNHPGGVLLKGSESSLRRGYEKWSNLKIDQDLTETEDAAEASYPSEVKTIASPVSATGPGTFFGKSQRTVRFFPGTDHGWWLDRSDLPDCLPTKASIYNVWTTGAIVRNIVLRSGPPENYIRMVEHMIALKLGMGLDSLNLQLDSGDPPLFDDGSLSLVNTFKRAGIQSTGQKAKYFTVKEPVSVAGPNDDFLTVAPCRAEVPRIDIDCAVEFNNAIGQQRIRFPVTTKNFCYGAQARTNTTAGKRMYCRTIGKLFSDIRNLGYTDDNVLVAGKKKYFNEPRLVHEDKSLEVVWHRAILDLLAAFTLIDGGRFVGEITAYKGGHQLDIELITQLYLNDLLTEYKPKDSTESAC